jgi:chaperone modulatory protein CbpM
MRNETLSGELIGNETTLTVRELCRACSQQTEWVLELVDEGVLEPLSGSEQDLVFSAIELRRARTAMRLQRDLGVNLSGIALILDLL